MTPVREVSLEELAKAGRRLIRKKELLRRVPLSERTIYNMERNGEFPRRFALGKTCVAWDEDEIDAFIRALPRAELAPPPEA